MKKVLLSLFLILSLCEVSFTQSAPSLTRQYSFGAVGTTAPINISSLNLGQIKSNFSNQSSVAPTSCTYSLQQSPDNITYTDITGQSAISCTNLNGGETPLVIIGTTWLQIKINTYVAAQANQILTVGFSGYTEVQGSNSSNPVYTTSSTSSPDNVRIQDGTGTTLETVTGIGSSVTSNVTTGGVVVAAIFGQVGSTFTPMAGMSNVGNTDTNGVANDGLKVGNYNFLYNGSSNWQRQYTANAAANSTGSGLAGVNNLVYDGANFQVSWNANKADGSVSSGAGITAAGLIAQDPIAAQANRYLHTADSNGGTALGRDSLSVVGYIFKSATNFQHSSAVSSSTVTTAGDNVLAVEDIPSSVIGAAVVTYSNTAVTGTKILVSTAASHNLYTYDMSLISSTTACWVQFFDAASTGAVTLGTTQPKWQVQLPGVTASPTTVNVIHDFAHPINFANGIVIAVTTGATGGTTCATSTNINLGYQ